MKTLFTLVLAILTVACMSQAMIFNAADTLDMAIESGEQKKWTVANALYRKIILNYEQNETLPEEAHMRAYRRMGIDMKAKGIEDSARYFLSKSTELYLLNPISVFNTRVVDNFNQMVFFYGQRSILDSAMVFCQRGIDFVKGNHIPPNSSTLELHGNLSFGYQLKGEFSKSFAEAERGLQMANGIESIARAKVSRSYLRYAQSLTKAGMCKKAQRYLDTAYFLLIQDTAKHIVAQADLLIRKAQCYGRQSMHELKLNALNDARALLEIEADSNHAKFAFLYHFYAAHYQQFRDYERAMVYQYKVIELLKRALADTPGPRSRYILLDLGTAHSNLGDILLLLGKYDEAIPHFQNSLDADLRDLGESGETVTSYNNFGRLYFAKGDIPRALEYYFRAEKIVSTHYSETPSQAVNLYNDIGREYFVIGDINTAHQYFLKSRSFHNEDVADAVRVITYYNLAESASKLDSVDLAEAYFQNVLSLLQVDISQPIKIISGREERAINTLIGIAQLKVDPDSALQYLLPAHTILQKLVKKAALGDEAQLRFREIAYPLYESIQIAYLQLGKPRKAIQYCDITKSGLLRQRWIETEALEAADVPADLLDLKRSLQYELAQISDMSRGDEQENARAFLIQTHIDSIDREILIAYPKYADYFNDTKVDKTNFTQDQESIICFFSGLDSTLAYVMYGDDLRIFWFSTDTLTHVVQALNTSVSQDDLEYVDDYEEYATHLADILSPAFEYAISFAPNRLTILPDGPLSFTPFEILRFGDSNGILLQDFPIRYLTSLGGRMPLNSKVAKMRFAGFAPSYTTLMIQDTITDESIADLVRSGYYSLPGAAEEVEVISNLMGGDRYVDNAATKSAFLHQAPKYQILHMSMHAIADIKQPGQSRLLFTANPENRALSEITASEIQALKFNADLVVLSACQTNVGKLYRGEGVMSLSRAFAFAGVPSSITSLWKVPDASTAAIMQDFYLNLLNGEDKDNALRLAKLNYLSNVKFKAQLHPRYWAGFVLTGDFRSIRGNSNHRYWIFSGLVILLLLLIFAVRGSRSKSIQTLQ